MIEHPSNKAIEHFRRTKAVRAPKVLSVLGKNEDFIRALETPVGQELLKDIIESLEMRLEKIVNEDADDKDRAEFRVLKEIHFKWIAKINQHQSLVEEINST